MSEKCNDCWFPLSDHLALKKQLPHAIIFEGSQGSGKTTLSRLVANVLQTTALRGFPSGEEIKRASGKQSLLCHRSFNLLSTNENGSKWTVFDRSPISHFVYMIKTTGDRYYLDCLKHTISEIASKRSLDIFFVHSPIDICLIRQEKTDLFLGNTEDMKKEIDTYNYIHKYIHNLQIENVRCHNLFNGENSQIEVITENIINLLKNVQSAKKKYI